MFDLKPEEIVIIRKILEKHLADCEVRVFGSRYHNKAKPYSDLDIAVLGPKPINWEKLALLKEAFQNSTLPFRVDVIDWHGISSTFKKTIEENGYGVLSTG